MGVLRLIERFLRVEAASGIVLLSTALIALVWANSPWSASYEALWHLSVGPAASPYSRSLHFWVNDVLMTIFFFVAALEIRREMHAGELSELKRAAVPLIAALGGMVVPALIYAAFNVGHGGSHGWGAPMATDIAFAVGVLALLGKRVPAALRVLLLALAVIDDIGGILVIAIFYSSGVNLGGLALALLGVLVIVGLQRFGIKRPASYFVPALLVWIGMNWGGIHPAIAGVVVGLLTPVGARLGTHEFQSLLHMPVAFGIMPLFALANAGVNVSGARFDADHARVGLGLALGLFLGKPLGITLATLTASKLGIATLPRGVNAIGVLVVGITSGIGFTVALFVADLAFHGTDYAPVAKLAILVGSLASGLAGLAFGRFVLSAPTDASIAQTAYEAETSTET